MHVTIPGSLVTVLFKSKSWVVFWGHCKESGFEVQG